MERRPAHAEPRAALGRADTRYRSAEPVHDLRARPEIHGPADRDDVARATREHLDVREVPIALHPRAGEFGIEAAITLDDLQKRAEAGALAFVLLPPDAALSRLPFLDLDVAAARLDLFSFNADASQQFVFIL